MKNIYPFALFSLLLTACNSTDDFNVENNTPMIEDLSYITWRNDYQRPYYEGLWRIENNQGIHAILFTDGQFKLKESEETSFNISGTYNVEGTITLQSSREPLALTVLSLTPSSTNHAQTFLALSSFQRNDSTFLRIYSFNENPLVAQKTIIPDANYYYKVGDVYQTLGHEHSISDNSSSTRIYFVKYWYFWAAWCGPCKMQSPINYEFVSSHPGVIDYQTFDVDTNATLVSEYKVSFVPTMFFLDPLDSRVLGTMVGLHSLSDINLMYTSL
ncbi:MAG: thioredoxin family protein [Bacteroidaceae bacterium]|nr:thioredoxin family protein [Bacteroidaceae bacterium]